MYCKRCGTKNAEGANFCKKCGAPLGMQSDGENNTDAEREKSRGVLFLFLALMIILAAVICVVFFVARGRSPKSLGYGKYMASAEKYLEDADYERAEDCYLKAIDIEPKKVEPYIGLADLFSEQGDYDKAKEYYRKAIDLEPSDARAYLGLSNVFFGQKDYEQAEKTLKNAIEEVQDEAGRAELRKQQKKVTDARDDRIKSVEPGADGGSNDKTKEEPAEAKVRAISSTITNDDQGKAYLTISDDQGRQWNESFGDGQYERYWGDSWTVDLNQDGQNEVVVVLSVIGSTYGAAKVNVYAVVGDELSCILQMDDDNISNYDSKFYCCLGASAGQNSIIITGGLQDHGTNATYSADEFEMKWNGADWIY